MHFEAYLMSRSFSNSCFLFTLIGSIFVVMNKGAQADECFEDDNHIYFGTAIAGILSGVISSLASRLIMNSVTAEDFLGIKVHKRPTCKGLAV